MAITKNLVCLANSRKNGGRCVAGIGVIDGFRSWIRPVGDRPSREVNAGERQYQDGMEPQILDVVAVPLVGPLPRGFQRENWLLDSTECWRKVAQIRWDQLRTLEEHPSSLWINGHQSSAAVNDRVPVEQGYALKDSLKLIRVNRVTMEVRSAHPASLDPTPTVRARFQYEDSEYVLRVTDPVREVKFRTKGRGEYDLGECFLTVSLGEAYQGYFYKLVAAVIERAEVE
ncbi:dual OB domain-containing protein [Saccharopolyspora shandongensis]|uniref:dual OB domain-containing protein n=1 Tax=Saccharopolyspora shandongensis TaxID=418495 RepID=UPI0033C0051F